jgi:hypothetical protein
VLPLSIERVSLREASLSERASRSLLLRRVSHSKPMMTTAS